ncbi:MAG: [FeFe] hydrogenase, group A [Candidatus Falkowbacteria bacterium]
MASVFTINKRTLTYLPGETVLQAARRHNIFIPSLCFHPDFKSHGNCRLCLVEIISGGRRQVVSACSTPLENNLEVFLDTPKIKRLRRTNLELLFAEHVEKCATCKLRFNCPLLTLVKQYRVKITRFPDRKTKRLNHNFPPSIEGDSSQCIDCRLCLEACNKLQKLDCLALKGHGANQEIVPTKNPCTFCGQCVTHCPVDAISEQVSYPAVNKILADPNKIVIAQFAPSIRAAIGEEFGLPYDDKMTGRVIAGLKKLGFNYVFDVNFGADITTIVEAEELIERLKNKKAVFPMMTSCCPAWVRYVESRQPDLIPHLTSARSPHIHLGGVIKTYWANKMGIDPKNIIIVSVMPCTAKKYEITRPEFKILGLTPVDQVITTREFALMMKNAKINFAKLAPKTGDLIWNDGSGAGAIYGASGGVMESALRTTVWSLEKKKSLAKLEFKEVRGVSGIKESIVNVAGQKLRVAVVNGLGNIDKVLSHLNDYDYIEVMSCPGGCIGGGGQPSPVSAEIRAKRMAALYSIDSHQEVRRAHENKEAMAAVEYVKKIGLEEAVLHTSFKGRK